MKDQQASSGAAGEPIAHCSNPKCNYTFQLPGTTAGIAWQCPKCYGRDWHCDFTVAAQPTSREAELREALIAVTNAFMWSLSESNDIIENGAGHWHCIHCDSFGAGVQFEHAPNCMYLKGMKALHAARKLLADTASQPTQPAPPAAPRLCEDGDHYFEYGKCTACGASETPAPAALEALRGLSEKWRHVPNGEDLGSGYEEGARDQLQNCADELDTVLGQLAATQPQGEKGRKS